MMRHVIPTRHAPLVMAWLQQLGAVAVTLLATTTAAHFLPASLFVRIADVELNVDEQGAPVLHQTVGVLPLVVRGLRGQAALFVVEETGGEAVLSPCGVSHECGAIGLLLDGSRPIRQQPVVSTLRATGCILSPGRRHVAAITYRFSVLGFERVVPTRSTVLSLPPRPEG